MSSWMRVLRRPCYSKKWNTLLFSLFQRVHPCLCTHSWNLCLSYPFPFPCKKQKKKEKKTYQAHGFQSVIKFSVSRGKGKVGLDLLCPILFQGSCLASGVKTRFLPSNLMLINVMGEIVDPWACHMVGNNVSHSALYKHAFLSSCRPS